MNGNRLLALVLALGAVNALLRPVAAAFDTPGSILQTLLAGGGVSWIIWGALALGLTALWRAPGQAPTAGEARLAWLALLLYLVPSATASWLATGAIALAALRCTGCAPGRRAGLTILAAAALREPLTTLLLQLGAEPLLTLDAQLVRLLLALAGLEGVTAGNIVGTGTGHRLLVLTGCSTFANLSLALLGWFAVTRYAITAWRPRALLAGMLITAAVTLGNVARLAAMSLDKAAYDWWHAGPGVPLFDTALVASVLLLTLWGIDHDHPVHAAAGSPGPRPVRPVRQVAP